MIEFDPATVPGYTESVAALTGLTEGTLNPADVERIVVVVMGVSRLHVQAEMLADTADDFELAGDRPTTYQAVGKLLDAAADRIRKQATHG